MKRGVFSLKSVLATIGFVLVALDCGRAKVSPSGSSAPAPDVPPPSALAAPPTAAPLPPSAQIEDERNTISVFRAAAASTVFVTQKRIVVDYFGGRALEVPSGTGTGFVWDEVGHVVTNYHVVRGARGVSVTLHDHKSFDARIIGVEPRKDIAVLKIDAPRQAIHPVRLPGKGYLLEVGQKAIAIGNPFGLDQTLTTGVISAFGREVEGIGGVSIRDMVQTDAAINPGNSGGPLLDSAGQLIGMNTMIYSRSGASAGIGFAVPVSTIARVVPQIIKTGKAEQVGLGVTIDPMQRLERRAEIRGVIVLSVQADGPAAKAGLRGVDQTPNGIVLGDVIVEIDSERIEDYDDLYNTLDKHAPGDVVRVTVIRNGKKLTMSVELTLLQ
jgi:S1-C subfamily serine protease